MLKNIQISVLSKLFLFGGGLISLLISSVLFYSINDLLTNFNQYKNFSVKSEVSILELKSNLNYISRATRQIMLGGDYYTEVKNVQKYRAKIIANYDKLKEYGRTSFNAAHLFKALEASRTQTLLFIDTAYSVVEPLANKSNDTAALLNAYKEYSVKATPLANTARETFEDLSCLVEEEVMQKTDELDMQIHNMKKIAYLTFFLFLSASVPFLILTHKLKGLEVIQDGLMNFFDFLNRKTKTANLVPLDCKDEFGQMAALINDNIQKISKEQMALIDIETTGFAHIKEGVIVWSNAAFEKILGYKTGWLQNAHIKTLFADESEFDSYYKLCNETLSTIGSFTHEIKAETKHKTEIWLLANITAVHGSHSDVMLVINDITRQKKLEQELHFLVEQELTKSREKDMLLLRQSRLAAMGEMIANIAHQWRQPLHALSACIQSACLSYDLKELDEKKKQEFETSSAGLIKHMSDTIDIFRNFFMPDKQKSEFNAQDIIQKSYDLLKPSFKTNNIKVTLHITNDDATCLGYPNEFAQVIINIFNNSKDAFIAKQNNNRNIEVYIAKNPQAQVYIKISDNAGGIPNDILEKIFDPYFTTKHQAQGTGIGLYMSKMIIERNMGGKLSAHNDENGAVFEIVI